MLQEGSVYNGLKWSKLILNDKDLMRSEECG